LLGLIEAVELRLISMPLVHPFETSFMRETDKDCILVRALGSGLEGWGEVVAMPEPLYNEETIATCWHMLVDFLIPKTLRRAWKDPGEWAQAMRPLRRNYMAKAGLEGALWDLYSQVQGKSLAQLWGGRRSRVPVGVSLGIEASMPELLAQVEQAVEAGYRRIKLKIKPTWDVAVVREVRRLYPQIQLQVDANSAYTLDDVEVFRAMEDLDLLLIEQPLAHDDIIDHATLQGQLATAICLDESIHSRDDCRKALQLQACRIINIKPGRVGGFCESLRIHELCQSHGVPVWCGGMLETGVGRLQNLALASLDGFTLPGDLSASARYFREDIIDPPVTLESDGCVVVPTHVGLGGRLDLSRVEHYCQKMELIAK